MLGAMHVQEFLRSGLTIHHLAERYKIEHARHAKHENLVLLRYSHTGSPMAEPIVRECRGLVLDEADNWRVVSRTFDKFFNRGEGHGVPLDPATTRYQEKCDGTLITVYPYNGKWEVQTSGRPDAMGRIGPRYNRPAYWTPAETVSMPMPTTFADYFWQVVALRHPGLFDEVADSFCFAFELTGPLNPVVVRHKYASITLIGGRDLFNGKEITVDEASRWLGDRVPKVREFPLTSIEEMKASFFNMSPLSQEGYVRVDANFNREKCKSPAYIAMHHAMGEFTEKAFLNVVRTGEASEVLSAFPDNMVFTEMVAEAKAKVDAIDAELSAAYEAIKDIGDQKVFVQAALKTRCSGAMFNVRSKRSPSIQAYVATMPLPALIALIAQTPVAAS
jgi:hypothetical protein